MKAKDVIDLIIESEEQAKDQIWLIASETLPSPFSRLALSTSAVNRYLFKYQVNGKRFCPGTEIYQQLYDYCTEILKKMFHAKYVSLRPISGMNAMTLVIATYLQAGELMFSIDTRQGGHTHTDKIVGALGRRVHHMPVRTEAECFFLDYEKLEQDFRKLQPRLLYLDPMSCQFQFDLERIRKMLPAGCAMHYDTSHVMAFVLSGNYPNVLDLGCDSLGGSTHKTFPSVQKAFFATNNETHFERFEKYSGQMLSSLHTASIISLAVTLAEAEEFLSTYGTKVIENARACCEYLAESGFTVIGPARNKTDCHVIFMQTSPHCEALDACYRLSRANIVVHPLMLPVDPPRMGLRLGVQEITALGMGRSEIRQIVDIFRRVLIEKKEPEDCAAEIISLRRKHQHPSFSFTDQKRLDRFFSVLFK